MATVSVCQGDCGRVDIWIVSYIRLQRYDEGNVFPPKINVALEKGTKSCFPSATLNNYPKMSSVHSMKMMFCDVAFTL